METLLSGTSLAAAPLAMAGRIGAIAPGLVADLVATAPNPLEEHQCCSALGLRDESGKPYRHDAATH